jgi:hypothetical protein
VNDIFARMRRAATSRSASAKQMQRLKMYVRREIIPNVTDGV